MESNSLGVQLTEPTQSPQTEETVLPVSPRYAIAPLVSAVQSGEPTTSSIAPPEEKTIDPSKAADFQWRFAEEIHKYTRELIQQADQKAIFFFAASTALIAFLYEANLVQKWIAPPIDWMFLDMLSFFATAGLAISAFASLLTIRPRLKGSKRGIIFFGAIAEFETSKLYAADVLNREASAIIEEKLCHLHDLANVCNSKFVTLKIGILSGAIGVVVSIVLLILSP